MKHLHKRNYKHHKIRFGSYALTDSHQKPCLGYSMAFHYQLYRIVSLFSPCHEDRTNQLPIGFRQLNTD